VSRSGPESKPFLIPKQLVWEAYRRVKANKGAAGVDEQSLGEFESGLRDNLYKIWNRMSSGTYFPPPVMAVEIPKASGGTRILGVPTVADRVAQTVAALALEARTESIFHEDSYGYRPRRGALDAVAKCRLRCWEKDWVIDLDVQKFFDSVPWDLMVKAVEANITAGQKWVLLYVKRWLAAPLQLPDGTLQQRDWGLRRVLRCRPCWRICSCTTRSICGWPGNIPGTRSSDTQTMPQPVVSSAKSIAVLPFTNMSADAENEYFTDGMAEEIINALSKIQSLRVASRTASFAFKGKSEDIAEIGRKLKVSTFLEGSVRKMGNRLRITAQLVNVADGYHLWSERYDREMEDIFAIQDEIALAIANTLKVRLLAADEGALVSRGTEDFEAYNHFLKGKYFFNRRVPREAIAEFEQAIARDPGYAAAYNGLADAIWVKPGDRRPITLGTTAAAKILVEEM